MDDFDQYFNEDIMEFEDEGPQFKDEITAFERAGPSGRLHELISGDLETSRTPEDRFKIAVDAISRRLNGDNITPLTENDINNMLEKTLYISGLQYMNPIAYILGFVATKGGKSMEYNDVMNTINNILPELKGDGGVTPPDVIRYARYWNKFL